MRPLRAAALPCAALAISLVALWPTDAFAWGPLAHLSFSSAALQFTDLFSPATRLLLQRFAPEFLYGSLAADIIVGKNLARYAVHCHNWTVGFRVLERARTDAQRAFSFGFLAHLAVDTVAHNYYVPYKTVEGFHQRGAGHAYWELRYDQQLPNDLWRLARQVSRREYRTHDEHLEEVLSESYVIPFAVSRKLFGSLLLAARLRKWQRFSELIAREKDLSLYPEEVRECRKLAVGQIVGMLQHGARADCTRADPTGSRNLHLADVYRGQLKARGQRESTRLALKARASFREGIYGRLELPAL